MTENKMLADMLYLATDAHNGQYDLAGMPYMLHPISVMYFLGPDADEELKCIALGHDLLEDTEVDELDLMYYGMTERVIAGIKALTKLDGEPYEDYQAKVMANPDAVRVKMCDLRHNSGFDRLKGITPKDAARLAKYAEFYFMLKNLTPA